MLLWPNRYFNGNLYEHYWTKDCEEFKVNILLSVCGYPYDEASEKNGYPLKEMIAQKFSMD